MEGLENRIQIEGRHLKITKPIQEYIHKKADHLDKYFDGIMNMHVILSHQEPKDNLVEIVCNVVKHQPLVAKAHHEDMYVAIDDAVHKIREHAKKFKERMRTRKRQSGRMTDGEQPEQVNEEQDES